MVESYIKKFSHAATKFITGTSAEKYFSSQKKGEIYELKNDLNSKSHTRRKEAVKMVIASMTVGNDVSSLFPDVLKCIHTKDVHLKKLVYLYLMNYAKSQPELVVLAVNTFCVDAEDENPLIRAMAIRTMGCLRVRRVLDYICEPLKKALNDPNPYVRKTAALCVPKICDFSPELVSDFGYDADLQKLLLDKNPLVVANAICALSEVHAKTKTPGHLIKDATTLFQLLSTLNDCTEWGQVYILDILANYVPANEEEALHILIHVTPRLNHVNSAVIMSSVRLILTNSKLLSPEHAAFYLRRTVSPLLTLLSPKYSKEIQYCALRNLKFIVRTFSDLFVPEINSFFCRFNDSLFIKKEKIEIIFSLISNFNYNIVLNELIEYSKDTEINFCLFVVELIGKIPMRVPDSLEEVCNCLLSLFLNSKMLPISSQCICSLVALMRRFTSFNFHALYDQVFAVIDPSYLSDYVDINDADCMISFLWFCSKIYSDASSETGEKVRALLEDFCQSIHQYSPNIQSQLVSSVVECYLNDSKLYLALDFVEKIFFETKKLKVFNSFTSLLQLYEYALKKCSPAELASLFSPTCTSSKHDDKSEFWASFIPKISMLSSVLHSHKLFYDKVGDRSSLFSSAIFNRSQEPLIADLADLNIDSFADNGLFPSSTNVTNLIDFLEDDFEDGNGGSPASQISIVDENSFESQFENFSINGVFMKKFNKILLELNIESNETFSCDLLFKNNK